jgi:hypothetical protein
MIKPQRMRSGCCVGASGGSGGGRASLSVESMFPDCDTILMEVRIQTKTLQVLDN